MRLSELILNSGENNTGKPPVSTIESATIYIPMFFSAVVNFYQRQVDQTKITPWFTKASIFPEEGTVQGDRNDEPVNHGASYQAST